MYLSVHCSWWEAVDGSLVGGEREEEGVDESSYLAGDK